MRYDEESRSQNAFLLIVKTLSLSAVVEVEEDADEAAAAAAGGTLGCAGAGISRFTILRTIGCEATV